MYLFKKKSKEKRPKITAGPNFCINVQIFFNDVKNHYWIFNFIKECNIGSDIFLKNTNIAQEQVDLIISESLDYIVKINQKIDYLNLNINKSLKLLLELLELLNNYNSFLKLSFSIVNYILTDKTIIIRVNELLKENHDNINKKNQEIDDFKIYIKNTKSEKRKGKIHVKNKNRHKILSKSEKDQFDRVKGRSDKYIKDYEKLLSDSEKTEKDEFDLQKEKYEKQKEKYEKQKEKYEKQKKFFGSYIFENPEAEEEFKSNKKLFKNDFKSQKQIYEQSEDKNILYLIHFPDIILDYITGLYSELYILNMKILNFNYL